MKSNREGKGPPAADLLVCFPSRAHLSLMPKPICSPARPSDSSALHHHHRRPSHHHHLRKPGNRGGGAASHGSPLLWAKTKHNSADISEPTSPKVTCAGQIKVRTKPSSCKNWQSVMEEIEKLHNNRKNKKRPAWIEALGFKKDVMQFLACLRSIRFDFRCFGAIPSSEITSDEEDDEDDDDHLNNYRENNRVSKDDVGDDQASRAVFSKWFMILQENNASNEFISTAEDSCSRRKVVRPYCDEKLVVVDGGDDDESCEQPPPPPPPPNALLLMRCRSAPAKSWLEEKEEERNESEKEEEEEEAKKTDLSEFSCGVAKEIRVLEGIQDKISRSRSWKR